MPRKSIHRLDTYLPRLGKEPDHQIAADAGVSRSLIIGFRKKHGIPAYEGYKFGAGNPPPAARAAAERAATGAPKPTAKANKASKAAKTNSGRKPGRPRKAAVEQSQAAFDPPSGSFRGRRSALDAYVEMLGKVPDADIAKLAGVTPENVRTYRTRRGIGASWPESGARRPGRPRKALAAPAAVAAPLKPIPSAHAAPVASPAPPQAIFSVTVEVAGVLRVYAVAAPTISAAVTVAHTLVGRKHPNGVVKAIAHIAEFLG
jgi:hypothetical protein